MQISHKNTVTYKEGLVTLEIMTTANEFSDLKRIFLALTGAGEHV